MDDVRARFEDISADLNLDSAVSLVAWSNFDKTRKVFCLEGNPLHWIACSLTHACWQANVDTVQGQGANPVHAGGVSLNNILRKCEIDFRQYFTQINKWNDMNSVPEAFRVRNDQLRKNYTNTMHMYRKYWDKFLLLFNYYGQEELVVNVGSGGTVTGARRNGRLQAQQHKKEKIKCTARSLYEFCWCLYASIKAEMNDNVKDLIMTHSLLLCCLDLMFANCWAERRFDLINPKFPGLPADWRTLSQSPSNVPPCILKHLSDDNPLVEVLEMKKYMFQRALTKLVKEQTLSNGKVAAGADPEPPYHSLLSEQNFDGNFRGINKHYDEYVLNNGQIDEKLFLVADNFGMPQNPHQGIGHDGAAGAGQVPPPTPLTRATDCLRRLNNILGEHHSASPPDRLIQLFKNCTNQPLVFIQSVIERNKKLYLTRVRQDVGNRFHTVVQVAYFLLGNFYEAERQRKKESVENLLTDENFLNSLLACSVEIVNSAYHNPMQFPWILECFELKAFVFYKIIEPVVQNHRDLLTCHVIKHLQRIEEQCMESYVWVDGSPVWDLLGEDALAPTCEASRAHVGAMGNGVQRNLFATGGGGDAAGASGELVVPPELASLHATIGVGGAGNGGSQPATPKKHSMTMFFRKFYIQAFNRLQTLFKDLEMGDAAQLTEVWTIFEYVIVHHLELMRNRHLDQLIMCAVYVYGRTKPDVRNAQFKTIMQKYRNQPHSSSHVYRGVYLGPSTEAALQAVKEQDKANSKPPRPIDDVDEQAGHAVSHPNEIRGDIIQFYNQVYMPKVQQFAVKFSREADRPPMSPVPQQVRLQNTPRKLCNALYVSTQEARCDFRSPVEIRLPHSSPMERHDFTQINEMIRAQPSAAKKRVLSYEGGDGETQIGGTQKLKKMMKDRTNMAK